MSINAQAKPQSPQADATVPAQTPATDAWQSLLEQVATDARAHAGEGYPGQAVVPKGGE